jgi:sugar/nucleoside kinase (ribokinase family)
MRDSTTRRRWTNPAAAHRERDPHIGDATRITALVVGSISRDVDRRDEAAAIAASDPGGVVHHAGLAFARLGAHTRVVTRIAAADEEELLAPLRAAGVEIHALPSGATTLCANDYRGPQDRHDLRATSDPIDHGDVPRGWRAADAIQIGPLHPDDVRPAALRDLRGRIGIDLQGLVRLAHGGITTLGPCPHLADYLERVQVVKASEEELEAAIGRGDGSMLLRDHPVHEVLVTRGAQGVHVYTRKGRTALGAPRVEARFPVGAGDVFLAAYLCARARRAGVVRAAAFALRASAAKISLGEIPHGFAQEEIDAAPDVD